MLALGTILIVWLLQANIDKALYIFAGGVTFVGLLFIIAASMSKSGKENGFVTIVSDLLNMPPTMKKLAVVQFFSWFALFAMWIYTTPAVTQYIFHTTDTTSEAYNNGADWVSILFAVYNGVAAIAAWLLTPIAKATNRKITHAISLILGGIGLFSIYFIHDQYLLLISMIGIGFAWASILSIPYAILTNALPHNKMGVYMGIFNYFIVLPQIVAAAFLGFLLKSLFNNEAIYALVLGGISMFIAAILVMFVRDKN